ECGARRARIFISLSYSLCGAHRALRSVPTRRSSDLAVAGGPPLVLVVEPVGHSRQRLSRVEAGGEVIDEALDECGDREDLLQGRSEEHTSELQSRFDLV